MNKSERNPKTEEKSKIKERIVPKFKPSKLLRGGVAKKMILPKSDFQLSIISTKLHPYIELISDGKKKAEGRVYTEKIKSFSAGNTLLLYNNVSYVLCKITSLNFYESFERMLLAEGVSNMLPFTNSLEEAIRIYNSFPGSERAKTHGVVAILLDPIQSSC